MSYFATCTFDLANASREDYQNAYADLGRIGFDTYLVGGNGQRVKLPTTMTAGSFNGTSAQSITKDLHDQVVRAFNARGFKSEIFITVGGPESYWWHNVT